MGGSVQEDTWLHPPPPTLSTAVCQQCQHLQTGRRLKSPLRAPHPVPMEIFLPNSHPNEVSRDDNEAELPSPLP